LDRSTNSVGWTVASGFRVLLFWGVQTARVVVSSFKPRHEIHRVVRIENLFPLSSWFFSTERSCCLAFRSQDRSVACVLLPGLSRETRSRTIPDSEENAILEKRIWRN
jgi:hypothetical protein